VEASELCCVDCDQAVTRKHRRADCECRYCSIWDAAYKQAKQDAAQAIAEVPYTMIDNVGFIIRHEAIDAAVGKPWTNQSM